MGLGLGGGALKNVSRSFQFERKGRGVFLGFGWMKFFFFVVVVVVVVVDLGWISGRRHWQ